MKIQRGRPLDWRFRVNDENVAMTMRSRFSVNETEAYLQCGPEGLGLIQLSEFAASAYLRSDRLKEVLASSRCLPVPIPSSIRRLGLLRQSGRSSTGLRDREVGSAAMNNRGKV